MREVPYEGSLSSRIYIVGEAPGRDEEIEGRPFVGGAGRILNSLLSQTGISRQQCRIANVMTVRPPNNDFKHFYIGSLPKPELIEGRRRLVEDIKRSEANVVIALGNEALKALLGVNGITSWRGSVVWSNLCERKVVPTIHPAALMRTWEWLPLVLCDLRRAKEESRTRELRRTERELKLNLSFEGVMQEIARMKSSKRVAYDLETHNGRITAVGLSDSPNRAICIPFTERWSLEEEAAIWLALKDLLEDERVEKVAHNAQFDNIILITNPPYIKVKGLVMDTMCAFHTVYPELPKSLETVCSIYTDQPYYKHLIHTEFRRYNALDAVITFECSQKIEQEMEEFGVKDFYYRLVHPLIPILMEMQLRGVRVDQRKRAELYHQLSERMEMMQKRLNEIVGREVNVMSPKQLKELLYRDLGLPPKYRRGTTVETTNEEALSELSKKHSSPLFSLILEVRGLRKLLGTYLNEKGGRDGRIRCSYVIGGTKTGRLASRESVLGGGTNLQNIPPICRQVFVADDEKVLIEADLSQAEARVVAYLSGEERLIRLFEKGGDIHRQNAAWIFSKPLEEVSKKERSLAKRLVHASNYGIGARAFAIHAGISQNEAKALLQRYFDTFPKIKEWQLRIQTELRKTRTLTTPFGRKRTFFGRGEQLYREAYAYIPQSTVADYLNLALIRLKERYPEAEVMLQVHDSIVIQCLESKVQEWIRRLLDAFSISLLVNGREMVIPVEFKVGKSWGDMKEVRYVEGS